MGYKRTVFGYGRGDRVSIGNEAHIISSISISPSGDDEPPELRLITETGLILAGPSDEVLFVLADD